MEKTSESVADLHKLLSMQVRLDIAKTLRENSTMSDAESEAAFRKLSAEDVVNGLVRDLARDEVKDTVASGRVPTSALFRLAGYTVNLASAS
jgi:DUF917 family protein